MLMDILTVKQLLCAAVGAAGFGLIYKLPGKYMPAAAIGGMLGWGVYVAVSKTTESVFMQALVAGFAVAVYSEILARIYRAPSTIFFVASVIPLVPGKALYDFMNALAEGDYTAAVSRGSEALLIAAGIAGGMGLAWSLSDLIRKLRMRTVNR